MSETCLRWLLPVLLLLTTVMQAQRLSPSTPAPRQLAISAKNKKPAPAAPQPLQAVVVSVSDTVDGRFVVPQVRLPNAVVSDRINRGLVDVSLGEDLEAIPSPLTALAGVRQAQAEYQAKSRRGFVGARYEVLYNDYGLLSVEFKADYLGAHPSSTVRHATFDLRTGRLLEVRDLVADTLALRSRWLQSINRRIANHLRKLPAEYPQMDADLLADVRRRLYWNDSTQTVQLEGDDPRFYDFALTPFGLMLYYDFGFPHVIEALQPDSDYLFSYAMLAPWLKPKGPLDFRREPKK
jgi:hypothetical protein